METEYMEHNFSKIVRRNERIIQIDGQEIPQGVHFITWDQSFIEMRNHGRFGS